MGQLRIFLGPGAHLIQPYQLKNRAGQYGQKKVPFGWYYEDAPFRLVRKATYLELYILTQYRLHQPLNRDTVHKGEKYDT